MKVKMKGKWKKRKSEKKKKKEEEINQWKRNKKKALEWYSLKSNHFH